MHRVGPGGRPGGAGRWPDLRRAALSRRSRGRDLSRRPPRCGSGRRPRASPVAGRGARANLKRCGSRTRCTTLDDASVVDVGVRFVPPLIRRRRPQPKQLNFRGSITRLLRSLSTLRPQGRPRPTNARLASGCRLRSTGWDCLPTGWLRQVSDAYSSTSSSPGLAWRDECLLYSYALSISRATSRAVSASVISCSMSFEYFFDL